MNLKKALLTPIVFKIPDKHKTIRVGHHVAYASYLGGAAWHGGFYGYAAAVLLLIVLIGLCLGEEL